MRAYLRSLALVGGVLVCMTPAAGQQAKSLPDGSFQVAQRDVGGGGGSPGGGGGGGARGGGGGGGSVIQGGRGGGGGPNVQGGRGGGGGRDFGPRGGGRDISTREGRGRRDAPVLRDRPSPPPEVREGRDGRRVDWRRGGRDQVRDGGRRHWDRRHVRRHGRPYVWGPGATFFFYDGYYYGECAWLRRRAVETGSRYWWARYRQCRDW